MSIHDRDREQLIAEGLAIAVTDDDATIRAWRDGLNERERETFESALSEMSEAIEKVWDSIRELMTPAR